jgi:HSP20 family protein
MVRSIMNRSSNVPTPTRTQAPAASAFPLSRVFDQFFNDDPFFALAPITLTREQSSTMALDFGEDENAYLVKASLPGFTQDDISCEVNDGVLTIRAEKSEEQEDNNQTWHRRERRFGSVVRQIQLPAPVVEDQANAELKDGVLTLRLPKVQKAPARRIAINGGRGTQDNAPHQGANGTHTAEQRSSRMTGNTR